MKEADVHRGDDKQRREAVEARNQLDSLVYSTEKLVEESGDKVPAAEKESVRAAISEAKKTLEEKTADAAALQKAAQELQKASYKIAEALYKTAPAPEEPAAPGGPSGGPSVKSDDVIDAEVVEEKK